MPCYYPVNCWYAKTSNQNGRYTLVYDKSAADQSRPAIRECGKCIGCKLERSRQWATRCVHEASLYDQNCFITLTYSDDHLDPWGSLNKTDWQLFMKRLRKAVTPKLRYYMCGEYGDKPDPGSSSPLGRPHYHAIIFGWTPADLVPHSKNIRGEIQYTSKRLESIWQNGYVIIGQMTFDSAAYVARYCTKKITGEIAREHYATYDQATGEAGDLLPEFSLQSNNPGLGSRWFEKYRHDCDKGYITKNGVKTPVPKYYLKLYEENHPYDFEKVKEQKRINQKFNPAVAGIKTNARRKNTTYMAMDRETEPNRLRALEHVKRHQIQNLKREI